MIRLFRDTEIMGSTSSPTANSIHTIEVYRFGSAWVFDDERVGLLKEAFVAGADTLIDKYADGKNNITIMFSTDWFPDHSVVVEKDKDQYDVGTNYTEPVTGHNLWLCPSLNLYYSVSPDRIYVKFKL